MEDANFNGARYFKECVVQYIEFNKRHIRYACTCTIHARKKYKDQSRVHHAIYTCTLLTLCI